MSTTSEAMKSALRSDKQFPELQAEFMKVCGQYTFGLATPLLDDYNQHKDYQRTVALWSTLINEEVNTELRRHLLNIIINPLVGSKVGLKELVIIADDIAASIYVLCGLANAMGIPLTRVFKVIHSANLDKAPNGEVLRRADGKILKPGGWKPADIEGILNETIANEYK